MTRYVGGDQTDQLFARISSGGNVSWYLLDHLGSVRDLTDNTGAVQDHIDYDAFGNVIYESTPSFGDRYKYTGRESDSETGLQYNRARYYDPKAGRWMAKDPIGFAAGDANLYRYVGNDPTSYVDPSGRGEQPTDDGSNLQWITQEKMKDLVDNKLAREVKVGVKSHRIIMKCAPGAGPAC